MRPETARNISIAAFVSGRSSCPYSWTGSSFLIVVSAIVVMLAYELRTKKLGLTGNLSIAWLTGALFLLGGAVVGKVEATVAIGMMAFLATLGREIVKDVQDMGSDFDRRTLPQRIGARNAGIVASAAFLIAVVALLRTVADWAYSAWQYLAAVLFADAIFIYCSIVHFRNPKQGQRWAKYGMLVALIAFLLGGLL